MARPPIVFVAALAAFCCALLPTAAGGADEPGISPLIDEPGLMPQRPRDPPRPPPERRAATPTVKKSAKGSDAVGVRLEFGFGLASHVVDPDVEAGYGGGLFLGWVPTWIGVEASLVVTGNRLSGEVAELAGGFTLVAGNVSAGPVFSLTKPSSRWVLTFESGIGSYIFVSPVQGAVWTFGMYFGGTLGVKIGSWFGIGIKPRYHLFNMATISGPKLLDLRSLTEVGVLDRFELPGFVALYF